MRFARSQFWSQSTSTKLQTFSKYLVYNFSTLYSSALMSERSENVYGSDASFLNPSTYLGVVHLQKQIMQCATLITFYISVWVEVTIPLCSKRDQTFQIARQPA
jgi:hypothetical protein